MTTFRKGLRPGLAVLSAAVLYAAPAAAQDGFNPAEPRAAPGHMDPTAMLLHSVCTPWIAGLDSARMTDMLRKRQFGVLADGAQPPLITPPDPIKTAGWTAVMPAADRKSCAINLIWVGSSPLDYIAADIQNWLNERAPGGPYRSVAEKRKDGVAGQSERVRAWESPVYEVTVVENPEETIAGIEGKMAVEVTVYLRRKS